MANCRKDYRGFSGRCGRAFPWSFAICTSFVLFFPAVAAPQTAGGPSSAAGSFGSGSQTPLRFGGDSGPNNLASLSLGITTLYDDNVYSINTERLGDEAVSVTSQVSVVRKTGHGSIDFGYTPFFMLYRQNTQFDRVNHAARLNAGYQLSQRVSLGLYGVFSYSDGIYPALTSPQILSGPLPPTSLNQSVFTPTARTLSNSDGLNITFAKTSRTSFTLSGGYTQQKFGGQAAAGRPLYSSRGYSGGGQYQYRITKHMTFGLLLLHQDSTYNGGEGFGTNVRTQSESAFASLSTQISPTVSLTLFGGPQYVRSIGVAAPGLSIGGQFLGAGGGSVTKQVRKTAFDLSLQRMVSSGGGLYTEVVQTSANFGVRRRLVGRWQGGLTGMGGRNDSSLFQNGSANTQSLSFGLDFSRPLSSGSELRIAYESVHQMSKGASVVSGSFDHDQITISFNYNLKTIPLGQ